MSDAAVTARFARARPRTPWRSRSATTKSSRVGVIDLGDGLEIEASTLVDLVAEKFRAMIQQPIRNRYRRQDAYDLYCLLEAHGARSRACAMPCARR